MGHELADSQAKNTAPMLNIAAGNLTALKPVIQAQNESRETMRAMMRLK
jgi:hypothetical protein